MTSTRRVVSCRMSARAAMLAHARRDAPRECCGLLAGRGRRIELAIPMANIDKRPRARFQIDPAEHVAVRRALRLLAPALQIVGVYHSHPKGPAKPSISDVAEWYYPDWYYAIVDGRRDAIRVFQIRKGRTVLWRVDWRKPARLTRRRSRRPTA